MKMFSFLCVFKGEDCQDVTRGLRVWGFFSSGVNMGSDKSRLTQVQMKIHDDKSDDTSKEKVNCGHLNVTVNPCYQQEVNAA